jgi:hypothetical protein
MAGGTFSARIKSSSSSASSTAASRRIRSSEGNSPGADKESNWLPAPKDADFSLYIRAYWPKAAILDGKWTPPAVERGK